MTSDTSERGLERLICTAMTGAPCDCGDASGVAEGDVFQQVREALHLTANPS